MVIEFDWKKGRLLGAGSFGCVNLVMLRVHHPSLPTMVVKSTFKFKAASLEWEKQVLADLRSCPHVVRHFGHLLSIENGFCIYNLFLEYISGGTLSDRILNSVGRRIQEADVRRYTKSLLLGLCEVHKKGYVHCDIKPENILLESLDSYEVKIADFGLALKAGFKQKGLLRGTCYYMSPESVALGEYDTPADIWALGCSVVEMITGKFAWDSVKNMDDLMFKMVYTNELPEIPHNLSEQGKDFLMKCFVKDPSQRWTAQMLLEHPFAKDDHDQIHYDQEQEVHVKTLANGPAISFILLPTRTLSSEALPYESDIRASDCKPRLLNLMC